MAVIPRRLVVCAATALLCASMGSTAHGQATPFVQPWDVVYRDIDRLASAGLIDTLVYGVRPFSEREVLRLLGEARRNLDRNADARAWAESVIDRDAKRFTRTEIRAVDAVAVEATQLDAPYRPAPPDSNGRVPATINPLAAYRGGRPLAFGQTSAAESQHSVVIAPFVAIAVSPRLTFESFRSVSGVATNSETSLSLQSAAVTLLFGNLSINAGRDYAIFGQSPTGGLLLSENAPPLDMVRISNDKPTTLPFVSRLLGPLRGELLVADLGGTQQIHPHSKLVAYHVAALPSPHFELGVEVLDAMGGNGGQPASFGDRVLDAVPIIDVFRGGSDFQFSNKMAAVDFHWRVPAWHGFDFYAQGAVDDFDARRLHSILFEDGGYLVGTSLNCLLECGTLGVRLEYHQTGIRFYEHPDYAISERGTLLGDPLGPRGLGAYLTIDGTSSRLGTLSVTPAFEVRSGNGYGATASTRSTSDFHFFQVYRRPAEKRSRVVASWMPGNGTERLTAQLTSGVERATDANFIAGATRTNWLASLGLVFRP